MSELKFSFKELDEEGLETLQAISNADQFNQWMYHTIQPYLSGRVLEIGSGIGNISKYFLESRQPIVLSDIRANYRRVLEKHFASYPSLQGVLDIDIVDPAFESKHQSLFQSFDGAFALNVVEHVEDDLLALSNIKKLVKPGGVIVILVPAFQALYNQFDEELCHYRRYTARSLSHLFNYNDISLLKTFYFNFAGIFGWYVSGKLQRNKTIPGGQMNLYNKLVPIFKTVDKLTFNKVGLSVICVGRVK